MSDADLASAFLRLCSSAYCAAQDVSPPLPPSPPGDEDSSRANLCVALDPQLSKLAAAFTPQLSELASEAGVTLKRPAWRTLDELRAALDALFDAAEAMKEYFSNLEIKDPQRYARGARSTASPRKFLDSATGGSGVAFIASRGSSTPPGRKRSCALTLNPSRPCCLCWVSNDPAAGDRIPCQIGRAGVTSGRGCQSSARHWPASSRRSRPPRPGRPHKDTHQ